MFRFLRDPVTRVKINTLSCVEGSMMSTKSGATGDKKDNRSIHSSNIEEVHNVPMQVIIRPIPPVLDELKVQSLMKTIKVIIVSFYIDCSRDFSPNLAVFIYFSHPGDCRLEGGSSHWRAVDSRPRRGKLLLLVRGLSPVCCISETEHAHHSCQTHQVKCLSPQHLSGGINSGSAVMFMQFFCSENVQV